MHEVHRCSMYTSTFAEDFAKTMSEGVNSMSELRTNLDWAGYFTTMAERMTLCESEEQMYRQIRRFKEDDFMPEYGRLSRAKRRKKGFRWRE